MQFKTLQILFCSLGIRLSHRYSRISHVRSLSEGSMGHFVGTKVNVAG